MSDTRLAEEQVSWADRLLKWLFGPAAPPRNPAWEDFITVHKSGAISFDHAGWWSTDEGYAELQKKIADMREFERVCRARDPKGRFAFYD